MGIAKRYEAGMAQGALRTASMNAFITTSPMRPITAAHVHPPASCSSDAPFVRVAVLVVSNMRRTPAQAWAR